MADPKLVTRTAHLACLLGLGVSVMNARAVEVLPRFRVTEVAGFASIGLGLNEAGDVVGMQYRQAFLWSNGSLRSLRGLPGSTFASSTANSINDSGEIAGSIDGRAVIWKNGVPRDLGQVEPWQGNNAAMGINNLGQVALNLTGRYDMFSTDQRAYRWESGILSDLGVFDRDYRGSPFTRASAINDAGWIVGSGNNSAFLWKEGAFQSLSSLGGQQANAFDLNSQGNVAGFSTDPRGKLHATIWRNGSPNALPQATSGYTPQYAWSLNDSDWAVGYGVRNDAPNSEFFRAFLYSDAFGTQDLASLIDKTDPLYGRIKLTSARGVNNRGQIIAESADYYTNATYLLTPISTCADSECAWRQGRSGSFADFANWDPAAVPVEASKLRVLLENSQTVSVPKTGSRIQALSVGTTGPASTLLTLSLEGILETTGSVKHIGGDVSISGGGALKVGRNLSIGEGAETKSRLRLLNGASVEVTGTLLVGGDSGGEMLITGSGSRVTTMEGVVVGDRSTGELRLASGAALVTPSVVLGRQSGGIGTLVLTDGDALVGMSGGGARTGRSRLDVLERISVGIDGQGTLELMNGRVRVGDTSDGYLILGRQGTISLSGSSSGLVVGSSTARGNVTLEHGSTFDFGTGNTGLMIVVSRGEASARGSIKGQLPAMRTVEPSVTPSQDSVLRLGGSIEVGVGHSTFMPGESRVAMAAHHIELGGAHPMTVVADSNEGRTVLLGGTTFIVPKIPDSGAPGGKILLMPEVLRIAGVSVSPTAGVPGHEVLNYRAVQQSSPFVGPSLAVPTFQSIASATLFATQNAVRSAAYLSNAIYGAGTLGPTMSAGGDGYKVLSSFDMDGLRAAAVQSAAHPQEISIVIRGSATLENLIADGSWLPLVTSSRGTFEPTDTLVRYVNNMSSFSAAVFGANPDASVRFVGHSLGGALSLLLARAMGVDAYAFNAPPLAEAYGLFLDETQPIQSVKGASRTDGLLNIRLAGDEVSGSLTRLPGIQPVGQVLTIDPVANMYRGTVADSPLLRASRSQLLGATTNYYSDVLRTHSIDSVIGEIESLRSVDVISRNGEIVFVSNPDDYTFESGDGNVLMLLPTETTGGVKRIESRVKGGRVLPTDPALAAGYQFESTDSSPAFSAVLLPLLDPRDQDYWIELLEDGQWRYLGDVKAGSHLTFSGGPVHAFRVRGITDIVDPIAIDHVFFGLVFASDGQLSMNITELALDGSPQPVPEPQTFFLLLIGIAVLRAIPGGRLSWDFRLKSRSSMATSGNTAH